MFALVLGVLLSFYLESYGIDLTNIITGMSFGGIAFDPIWRAEVTYRTVLVPIITLFIMGGLAVLYPAIKAALIQPVKAIHYR